ncbi:EAL domain-containing protein [Simplicispira lacusdiani]|uniref:EAL domain-containing protein n=1 Tax=Simplicispira lacusdiani TaxID=2213010 RepID=UPI000E7239BE|nr:EAL domain-containing protein [Simplicispira lacusdiani]
MKHTLALAAAFMVAAIVVPIALALQFAGQQARQDEQAYLASLAEEVLRRAVLTRQQIVAAVDAMQARADAPCSEAGIALMRQISMTSPYLQAAGVVRDNALVCSSLGVHEPPLALGTGQGRTATGLRAWVGVDLPIIPGQLFNVYSDAHGNAVIVHPEQIIDIVVRSTDVVLAVVVNDPGFVSRSRGSVAPDWLARIARSKNTMAAQAFETDSHTVVLRSSGEHNVSGLAAAPRSYIDGRMRRLTWIMLPIGLAAGLLLAVAVVLLARQRMSLKTELRLALQRKEFFLRYQPIVDLRDGSVVGAEALLRWQRVDGTQVPPDVFIPVAEQTGLIQDITRHVMDMVARDMAGLLQRRPGFHVSINFSALDLQPKGPIEHIAPLLQALQAPPGAVVLEITERSFVDASIARPLVQRIREQGVRVAIDDFGTGYSNLSALASFEIDYLKIDKSFVDTIGLQAVTSQVVPHIIEMAKTLGLEMIAEGVETQEQADYLRSRGVQFAQGWLYGKPMAVEDLMARVDACAEPSLAPADGDPAQRACSGNLQST